MLLPGVPCLHHTNIAWRKLLLHFGFYSVAAMETPHIYCQSETFFVKFYSKECSQIRGSGSATIFANCFHFGLLKSKMLSSSLPLPAIFFKVLPLPQKINRFHRFRFQLPLPHPCSNYRIVCSIVWTPFVAIKNNNIKTLTIINTSIFFFICLY